MYLKLVHWTCLTLQLISATGFANLGNIPWTCWSVTFAIYSAYRLHEIYKEEI